MTVPPPPDHGHAPGDGADDDVVAVLDGTATPEQRRRVARQPELRARLEEQRVAIAALADPIAPLPEEVAARLRDRALAHTEQGDPGPGADEDPGAGAEATDPGTVVPLAPRPPRRRSPGWPAVAAVVILLMGIGLTLMVTDRSGEESRARGTLAGESASAEAARDLGAEAAGDGGAPTSVPGGAQDPAGNEESNAASTAFDASDLVAYPDEEALARELRAVDPGTLQPPGAGPATGPAAGRAREQAALCDPGLRAVEASLQPVQASRLVLIDGLEVLVMSNPARATAEAPASIRLTALDARSCTPLFAVQR